MLLYVFLILNVFFSIKNFKQFLFSILQKKLKSICYLTLGGTISYQFIYFKKDFHGYYDNVLNPLSQWISPELAHKIGVLAIKYGIFPAETYDDPHVLVSTLFSRINFRQHLLNKFSVFRKRNFYLMSSVILLELLLVLINMVMQ